uniref:SCP domain-containing protein n=1 Tax=Globisporangium ultimum (strain ATCC 200006 / CBS 805.95 / DAOM BR144) TaxID=431595 RepID=K3WIC1_GLOUD
MPAFFLVATTLALVTGTSIASLEAVVSASPQHVERDLQTYTSSDNFQAQMLAAVNAERAKVGLVAFCTNKKLQASAQLHSNDQARNNFMSHTGSDGSSMSQRITAQSFVWSSIAENVAAGQVDVTAVMKAWMNSSGHKANILGNYKFFGTGYAYNANSNYKHYWTQDFGTGSSEACDSSGTVQSTTAPTVTPTPTTATPTMTPKATTATPAVQQTTTPTPTTKTPISTGQTMQQQMLAAVNAERAKVGLAAYCTNKKLQTSAQLHSEDQAKNNFMSHTGSNGSTMSQRITAQSFVWSSIAENVAAGQVDVAAVVKSWMNSSGHKANILGNYKFFGMGYAYNANSNYKHYWTQDFGTGSSEACE